MEKIDIKGKDYIPVNERLKEFRNNKKYEGWKLITRIAELNEKYVVFQADVINVNGDVIATGTAREVNGDSFINKTSYIENAETSSWGRALGNLGIGIDTSIATHEEIANAKLNQNKTVSAIVSPSVNKSKFTSKLEPNRAKKHDNEDCNVCDGGTIKVLTSKAGRVYWKCNKCGDFGFNIKTSDDILDDEIPF